MNNHVLKIMAIAISDKYLRDIYNLSNEDKLDLVDLIIKSMRVARSKINIGVSKKSINWVDELEGKWIDSRSADEMISDIRTARTNNSEVIL